MSNPLLFLLLLLLLLHFPLPTSSQLPRLHGYLLDCGSSTTTPSDIPGHQWTPDTPFISSGQPQNLSLPNLLPLLSTARSFPFTHPLHKFCYTFQAYRGGDYLVRATFFYGAINGPDRPIPPVFDLIVDGTLLAVVNTTADYAAGRASYYEGVVRAKVKTMSVCVAGNTYTESEPFVNALEVVLMEGSLYNSTDFDKFALRLVARNSFGEAGLILRYPDDQFDRYWEPLTFSSIPVISGNQNLSTSEFWNLPPSKIFDTALTTDQGKLLEIQWPVPSLPNSSYYIALYFSDISNSSLPGEPRKFDISINNVKFFNDLTVTSTGVAIFATSWPLSGLTKVTLSPTSGSSLPPLINGGEAFELIAVGGRTKTRDVIALDKIKGSIHNPPLDWNGDPCWPRDYPWTGVTCSLGNLSRVVSLNLSSMGLSGSLSPRIARLTALTDIMLGNNNFSGHIPDLGGLRRLERLHLQNNQFSGEIPLKLGNLDNLRELFVQNNNLTGLIPSNLKKPGLQLQ
ncbi:putative LRR receptor-like serine/threonine-protein kinase [Acorus calamus]|uniref:LRR receptor-like serine/threonine-protein kinase n=1 Tax=Acorus calamus TaxID=4465 RepID=A0AAV9CVT6_ACOCL|nr:putative LRR receptor-like serine/threonine-protein kinase [Acorus calamus]